MRASRHRLVNMLDDTQLRALHSYEHELKNPKGESENVVLVGYQQRLVLHALNIAEKQFSGRDFEICLEIIKMLRTSQGTV